jgi:stage II sporulation protein D
MRPTGGIRLGRLATLVVLAACGAAAMVGGCSCEAPEVRQLAMAEGIPAIRVKLGDDRPRLAVAVDGPYRLTADGRPVGAVGNLPWTAVEAAPEGFRLQGRTVAAKALELHPLSSGGTFRLRTKAGGADRERSYRGWLRIGRTAAGGLRPVNVVSAEVYVAGVLANELVPRWHLETHKAQAVAARTFAMAERLRRAHDDFDVFDSAQSQVYGGADTETATAWEAVAATRGVVAVYAGPDGRRTLLKTYYHSTCGGATCAAAVAFGGSTPPPLRGVTCPYCRASRLFEWKDVEITKREMTEALRRSGAPALATLQDITHLEVAQADPNGRAIAVRVVDTTGRSLRIAAGEWRLMVGPRRLPSTWFTVRDAGDRFLFDGHGWGHGVGLCQWGAQHLAERGLTGEQILRFYYPGVELTRAY